MEQGRGTVECVGGKRVVKPLVTVYTQVYNTKPFLAQCVDSVLGQTFKDFEYVLIDNGSTDGCKEMLEAYAARDERVKLIRFETNRRAPIWLDTAKETGEGRYVVVLDSDDWLDEAFLERMLEIAEQTNADIICTGSAFHVEGKGFPTGERRMPRRIEITKAEYPAYFPYYHQFFRTMWGKCIKRDIVNNADYTVIDRECLPNGTDTLAAFAWLRKAKSIYIDDSALHHYLIRNKSVYHDYKSGRFKSNVVLHEDAMAFLSCFGSISNENLSFLYAVYSNAVADTLDVLNEAALPSADKLQELMSIATHPLTVEIFGNKSDYALRCREKMFVSIMQTAVSLKWDFEDTIVEPLRKLFKQCGPVINKQSMKLFALEPTLLSAASKDERESLARHLLELIEARQYTKQHDLVGMLQALAEDKPLLTGIGSLAFFRKYCDIYWAVWQGRTVDALDEMTDILIENRVQGAKEEFIRLYIRLAAWHEEVPAYLFGNVKLAEQLLKERRTDECQAVLDSLAEMGLEENEEIAAIKQGLKTLQAN